MGIHILTGFKMAALAKIIRSGSCLARSATAGARTVSVSAVTKKDWKMPDPIEHATGVEKFELLAEQDGNDDPFFCKAKEGGKGTKEEPNIIEALDVTEWLAVYAMKMIPTSNGCGCSRTNPKGANVVFGSS